MALRPCRLHEHFIYYISPLVLSNGGRAGVTYVTFFEKKVTKKALPTFATRQFRQSAYAALSEVLKVCLVAERACYERQ